MSDLLIVTAADDAQRMRAEAWAHAHGYPWRATSDARGISDTALFELMFSANDVTLAWRQERAPAPLRVDFVAGAVGHRLRTTTVRQELLARAVGLHKKHEPLRVLDATAGLGRDGVLLAALGCEVLLVERAPWMAALLEDGLRRALADEALASRIRGRVALRVDDSRTVMREAAASGVHFDVVYLDPMFPHSDSSALPAKAMQALQRLLDESSCDADELLELALSCADRRVVVKRPRRGPSLQNREPSYTLTGRACRFDVYQITATQVNSE